jgi:hypothetical protein
MLSSSPARAAYCAASCARTFPPRAKRRPRWSRRSQRASRACSPCSAPRFATSRSSPSALAPTLELFGGIGGDRSYALDWDETFTSGLERTFLDRRRERERDFDAGARLIWQLGGAIYHPEEIDASREAREWLELRDEVLDEISQLYFERRRALLDLARERDAHLAARLSLRASELAAGLDAWTGGWFSAQLEALSPRGPAHELETIP